MCGTVPSVRVPSILPVFPRPAPAVALLRLLASQAPRAAPGTCVCFLKLRSLAAMAQSVHAKPKAEAVKWFLQRTPPVRQALWRAAGVQVGTSKQRARFNLLATESLAYLGKYFEGCYTPDTEAEEPAWCVPPPMPMLEAAFKHAVDKYATDGQQVVQVDGLVSWYATAQTPPPMQLPLAEAWGATKRSAVPDSSVQAMDTSGKSRCTVIPEGACDARASGASDGSVASWTGPGGLQHEAQTNTQMAIAEHVNCS